MAGPGRAGLGRGGGRGRRGDEPGTLSDQGVRGGQRGRQHDAPHEVVGGGLHATEGHLVGGAGGAGAGVATAGSLIAAPRVGCAR